MKSGEGIVELDDIVDKEVLSTTMFIKRGGGPLHQRNESLFEDQNFSKICNDIADAVEEFSVMNISKEVADWN